VVEPEIGETYDDEVVKMMDLDAFVNFFGRKDGLVHISELAPKRVNKTSDIVSEGQADTRLQNIGTRRAMQFSRLLARAHSGAR
jgi:polyribonucleotide nucleotidyltransferase